MQTTSTMITNNKGYALISMVMLLIVLIGAGSIVMVTTTSTSSNRQMSETIKKMDAILVAIAEYRADEATGLAPVNLNYLISDVGAVGCASDTANSKMVGWCGPYLDGTFQENTNAMLTDGWNTTFFYNSGGTLRSWGPDKTDNTGGGDDITRSF